MGEKGFVAACLEHRAEPAQIDDFVDLWHHSETDETLSEFLGMTPDEYALWVERPESLGYILWAHARGVTVEQSLEQNSGGDAEQLLQWWRTRSLRDIA